MYRDRPVVHACAHHLVAPAVTICARCHAPICQLCTTFSSLDPKCTPCAREHATRTRWKKLVAFSCAAGVSLGLAFVAATLPISTPPSVAFVQPPPRCDVFARWSEYYESNRSPEVLERYTHCVGAWWVHMELSDVEETHVP